MYLTSANLWLADPASGANIGGHWEFCNAPGSANAEMVINGAPRATTFALSLGDDLFTFQVWGRVDPGHAIGLWFGDNPAHFAGPVGAVPHLVAFRDAAGALATPLAGTMVGTWFSFSGNGPYHGNLSHVVGGTGVSVQAYSFDGATGQGSLTVRVVPAPGGLAALALAGLVGVRRRR
ncbi:MAG: hypothetical protein FJ255_00055 [Phycisphaerae bacterium]|nr:hypothetical protein [Phycisphaerae bacterium]